MDKLIVKVLILTMAIAIAGSGAYAGYFHDQSVKGVYSSLTPQIYDLQNQLHDRSLQVSNLQNQVSDLTNQVSNLNGQVTALNSQLSALEQSNTQLSQQIGGLKSQIATLQQQVSTLQQSIDSLRTQLSNLQAPNMDGTFTFTGGGCFFGCSSTVRGAWANYGTNNARSVKVTLTWSNAGTFVQTNTINAGVVPGQSISLYPDTSYTLSSQADHLDWSFTFTT